MTAQRSLGQRPDEPAGGPDLPAGGPDQPADDLGRGSQALYGEGDLAAARTLFEAAARAAIAAGQMSRLGQAALGLGGLWVHEHRGAIQASRVATWQRMALDALDPQSSLAVRLRIRLAAEQDYAAGTSEAILAHVEHARTGSDPLVLAESLSLAHHCLLAPAYSAQRLGLAREMLAAAGVTERPVDEMVALMWLTVDLLLAGDPHAERSLKDLATAHDRHPLRAVGFVLAAISVMQQIRAGDLDAAEEQAARCASQGQEIGDVDALGWYVAHMAAIRWFQGRMADLAPLVNEFAHSPSLAVADDSMFAAAAVAAAAAGKGDAARGAIGRLRSGGLAERQQSSTWLITLVGVIETARLLDDGGLAREAYDLLRPYADRPAMASLAVVCFGSVHHYLGQGALTCGDLDLAEHHFDAATAANAALGHLPALAASAHMLADVRGRLTDRDAASARPITCTGEGHGWRLRAGERTVVVPDSVGMGYLATLIAHPGQEVSVAALTGATPASAEPVLDEAARAAFKARIGLLRAELAAADAVGDAGRGQRAQEELDALCGELERQTGLGGRARTFVTSSERARTSVQKAIRRALLRIRSVDPAVADELDGAIVTGSACCYTPTV